jgi:hypothetical protein
MHGPLPENANRRHTFVDFMPAAERPRPDLTNLVAVKGKAQLATAGLSPARDVHKTPAPIRIEHTNPAQAAAVLYAPRLAHSATKDESIGL